VAIGGWRLWTPEILQFPERRREALCSSFLGFDVFFNCDAIQRLSLLVVLLY
jgi:hypothetical protein